jgi:hypothetical protein
LTFVFKILQMTRTKIAKYIAKSGNSLLFHFFFLSNLEVTF